MAAVTARVLWGDGANLGVNMPGRSDGRALLLEVLLTFLLMFVITAVATDTWVVDDPAGQPVDRVRTIRDDIRGRVEGLLSQLEWSPTPFLPRPHERTETRPDEERRTSMPEGGRS